MKMSDNQISIVLPHDEALVLFEFLSRFSEREKLQIEDPAEARALWNVQAALEELLTEPFTSDYQELVNQARQRVRDK
ncbi:MAG: hypothetical protein ACJ741_02705 [Pyrinomonadaceae bacterium]